MDQLDSYAEDEDFRKLSQEFDIKQNDLGEDKTSEDEKYDEKNNNINHALNNLDLLNKT